MASLAVMNDSDNTHEVGQRLGAVHPPLPRTVTVLDITAPLL